MELPLIFASIYGFMDVPLFLFFTELTHAGRERGRDGDRGDGDIFILL
jgi:hypothetical protein